MQPWSSAEEMAIRRRNKSSADPQPLRDEMNKQRMSLHVPSRMKQDSLRPLIKAMAFRGFRRRKPPALRPF